MSNQEAQNKESIEVKILQFLERYPNETFKSKELARRLKIRSEKDYQQFKKILRSLQDENKILRIRGKKYGHLYEKQISIGKLNISSRGFGIVVLKENGEEIFIQQENLGNGEHNDIVEVLIYPQSSKQKARGARKEGEVLRVIAEGDKTFVGTIERIRNQFFVVPVDKTFSKEILISSEDLLNAKENYKVVVELISKPTRYANPTGRVIEVLGKAGDLSTEIQSVAREYHLSTNFPREVIQEVKSISEKIPPSVIKQRIDLRSLLCFTIDPEDAKDFDDAISLESLPDGNYELGVHIADVSYYVKEGSALDKEAFKRGTSVYFPNGVIPMLPDKLSSDICCLKPEEDRLTFSVLINISPSGKVNSYKIAETIIHSKRRFTYEYVQMLLDKIEKQEPIPEKDTPFKKTLWNMYALSRVLTNKRIKEGSIDFDSAEVRFIFDDAGKPEKIIKKERLGSHRLIEEFMLIANRLVARHIGLPKKEEHPQPFLYRVHDSPDPDRIKELAAFVEKLGFKLNVDGGVSSKALQRLLNQVKGTEVENVVNEVVLRSMAKAIYSERNIGHYGLAFDYYAHFTSPIRRYPDLSVHRILKKYSEGISQKEREQLRQHLPYVAKQSSEMERLAMEAERTAVKIMQVEYMKRHIGDEFHAVISGVTHYGIFVELNDFLVEGMIHVRDLDDDYYTYDSKQYALKGRNTNKQYRLGDPVEVKLIRVNPNERQLDFIIVDKQVVEKKAKSRKNR